ncbi:diacylglyceryl transferase [Thiohalorhabdus denitrificans]|uniref:Phosphatidylglycerol--prolipoprotein diacylglyceryl transferase n=1 Tax=Thiohalorhabdus denitrificans TaxID=381306 RepID=A0A0P9GJK5_9GAMM|nr:prolipoprotein diacylglyceryl transferase [Thiohalorhabdus denitrificans]KPV40287.1 diacylglyceryl transferase [Thiohalorhabdus denitrificans]SCX81197.1 phosphatidylglycerol:prolipoprotein diacylglycerol transferase [Thiohalorhabdus denitrificans]
MLEYPRIDPVAIEIGPFAVHWYGLMYAAAFLLGWWLLRVRRHRLGLTPEDIGDLAFACILGVVLGGRLGYVLFYNPGYYLGHPLEVFAVWDGGMSFHGGLLGVVASVVWFARRHGQPILAVGDFLTPVAPIGLGLGRIGNFINGELWGRPADPDLPWAMVFPHVDRVPRHPSQLYEALLEGLVLFLVVWLYARVPRRHGRVFGLFLLLYGVLRFGVEYFRAPDPHLGAVALGLSMGQWLSVPMVAVGAWLVAAPPGRHGEAAPGRD